MKTGDRIFVWKKGTFVPATIVQVNKNVVCCGATDNAHTHDRTYDVRLDTGEISKGHLREGIEEAK